MVARETLQLFLPGLQVGIAAASVAARLIGGMLVGVTADPLSRPCAWPQSFCSPPNFAHSWARFVLPSAKTDYES
jgi:hypothetical protein